jgi:hypothetical protein
MNTVSSDIQSLITFINGYVVPLIFAVAFVVFLWGVFQYFIAGGASDEGREKGRQFIMYGIIGFVLMFSIWGIVSVLYHSFGFDSNARPPIPTFGGSGTANTNTTDTTNTNTDFTAGHNPDIQ